MNDRRPRKYTYYQKSNKRPRQFRLEAGLKGFLCSCNSREKDCIRESYNILNKFSDELYGSEQSKPSPVEENNEIEDELENELQTLKAENKEYNLRRFQVVESGAKNVLFIRTTLENPVELATTIIKDVYDSQMYQTRFLIRLVPIEVTCKAFLPDIKCAIEPLIDRHFLNESKTFAIMYNHRNNHSLNRDVVIKSVADIIGSKRDDHKVDLKQADICVVIEVIKNFVLIGIIPDFIKYKKFNLHAVVENAMGMDGGMEQEETGENITGNEENKNSKQANENSTENVEENTN